jgi:hypothetical protein
VSEWDVDTFHKRVLELEAEGFTARRESYRITADMNPENGIIKHVHTIELYRPKEEQQKISGSAEKPHRIT